MYVCKECGSNRVSQKYWCDVNTGKILDITSDDDTFCENCQEYCEIIEKK